MQVLCPMAQEMVGTRNLNQVLQQLINPLSPDKVEMTRGGITLRVGDRVIQQTNDKSEKFLMVMWGFSLQLIQKNKKSQYSTQSVASPTMGADLQEIALAWSVTIHKSQGSEYPVVILPLYTQHYMMLSRNYYTQA